MEFLSGDVLLVLWRQRPESMRHEATRLGEILAAFHSVPLADAAPSLSAEETLYSEEYFRRMLEISTGFTGGEQTAALHRCRQRILASARRDVLIHGDFGPHQIIVDGKGRWSLVDFEYAAVGSFADDVAGTELRLEQQSFPVEGFLRGYWAMRRFHRYLMGA